MSQGKIIATEEPENREKKSQTKQGYDFILNETLPTLQTSWQVNYEI